MIAVKSHRRGKAVVKAYTRAAKVRRLHQRTKDRSIEGVLFRARSKRIALQSGRAIHGNPSNFKKYDRAIMRVDRVIKHNEEILFPSKITLAKRAGDRARKIQAHRTRVMSGGGWV